MIDTLGSLLSSISIPLAELLHLQYLPQYLPYILLSASFFLAVELTSPYVSPIVSRTYPTLSKRTRHDWDIRVVSTANVLLVLPLAFDCFKHIEQLVGDKAFGTHHSALRLSAVAAGYFLWDALEALVNGSDIAFIVHGFATLFIFVFGLRPFVLYYAPISLLWELSTPFLNIHWFLDKTNRTGGSLQLVNGICLLTVFFGARICYGGWASYDLFKTLYSVRHEIPIWVSTVYYVGNISLNILNWIWFSKMISALKKRFDPAQQKKLAKTTPRNKPEYAVKAS